MAKVYKAADLFKLNPEKIKDKQPSGFYGCLKGKIHCTDYKKVFNLQ
ncbi:MAG: hypothetical protein IK117_02975 [Bacteroidales bacterium]|nr:hypothetical protein [Bacteroidales bacterium]